MLNTEEPALPIGEAPLITSSRARQGAYQPNPDDLSRYEGVNVWRYGQANRPDRLHPVSTFTPAHVHTVFGFGISALDLAASAAPAFLSVLLPVAGHKPRLGMISLVMAPPSKMRTTALSLTTTATASVARVMDAAAMWAACPGRAARRHPRLGRVEVAGGGAHDAVGGDDEGAVELRELFHRVAHVGVLEALDLVAVAEQQGRAPSGGWRKHACVVADGEDGPDLASLAALARDLDGERQHAFQRLRGHAALRAAGRRGRAEALGEPAVVAARPLL